MHSHNILDYRTPFSLSPTDAELLEQLSQGVWLADTKGRIRYTNAALNHMLGYESGELCGQSLTRLLANGTSGSLTKFREWADAVQTRGGWRGDCLIARKDGAVLNCFTRIHTRALLNENQWVGVLEAGAAAEFLKEFTRPYIVMALRDLQNSFDEIFGWARLIRAGQLNAQQAAEVLEAIERGTRSQQQLLNHLLELEQPLPETAQPETPPRGTTKTGALRALAAARAQNTGALSWKRSANL